MARSGGEDDGDGEDEDEDEDEELRAGTRIAR